MGRYYWNKRQEADSLKQVSVSFLKKHHYLESGFHSGNITWSRNGEETGKISIQSFVCEDEKYVRFIYTKTNNDTGEKKDFDYKISLVSTACYFGGKRYWFTCPWYVNSVYCGRRVGVVYLGGKHFACRDCHNLTYNSRNLGGISKTMGQTVSYPELEKMKSEVKRKHYRGKITRRYMRYLNKYDKSDRQMMIMARHLGGASIYRDAIR